VFLGIALCVTGMSFLRFPNCRVAIFLLCGLFVYDIWWVFFSKPVFGENVMVSVATKLELPVKLMFPRSIQGAYGYTMLGLGDIVLPGMSVCLGRKIDTYKNLTRQYFNVTFMGYIIGIFLSILMARTFLAAQPALLYLVPSTLLPMILLSLRRDEFCEIWKGLKDENGKPRNRFWSLQ